MTRDEAMAAHRHRWLPVAGCVTLLAAGAAVAGQLDSATYFALDRGMSESEVLVRAGPPDLVTHPGGEVIVDRRSVQIATDDPRLTLLQDDERVRELSVKQYHYIPDHREHDPHLTVITLRGGRVWEIERTKLLTRPPAPATANELPAPRLPSDTEIRIERVERVLSAAEAYAATRARLKAQAAADGAGPTPMDGVPVHRGISEEGVPYYGDTPPPPRE